MAPAEGVFFGGLGCPLGAAKVAFDLAAKKLIGKASATQLYTVLVR